MASPIYKAPEYDEKKYRQGIDTSAYAQLKQNYINQAEKQRATQLGEAQKTQQNALKQAYLQRAQNQRKLNENMAAAGIRGGATETSNLKLANIYAQARNAANTDYANSVNAINQSIDQNIFDYSQDMDARAQQHVDDVAQAKWTAERQDKLNEYDAANNYWNNYWLDYYSGYGKDKLDKALKKAKAKLKKATTQAQKIKIQQQIRGIQNRRGVIASQK